MRAAVAIQRELVAQEVQVRIGVHVGEVIVEPERLTGEAVNIAARIESFAVSGGVLSDAAYDQIKNQSDVGVVGLGRFKLKNVGRPFELYAVAADGVVVPDPAALEGKGERFATSRATCPARAPPLVGRADDPASLVALVGEHRVVTITGPGDVGKTRIVREAEVYAHEDGIVNVYSEETSGRGYVDQARAALSADDVDRVTEIGRRLTIKEALVLTRVPDTTPV